MRLVFAQCQLAILIKFLNDCQAYTIYGNHYPKYIMKVPQTVYAGINVCFNRERPIYHHPMP